MSPSQEPSEIQSLSSIPMSASRSNVESTLHTRFITNVKELIETLDLPIADATPLLEAAQDFPLRIPESILNRVSRGDVNDPILKQFLPSCQELVKTPGFSLDPLCEKIDATAIEQNEQSRESDCVLQKYNGRVLVLTTNECAARCRFCFRRHSLDRAMFPIPDKYQAETSNATRTDAVNAYREYFDKVFATVRKTPSIHEIIFSGGDPLTLSNDNLKALLHYIKSLKTVNRVRFHSRVPILVPQRIDDSFPSVDEFGVDEETPFVLHITLHVDVPNEIDSDVAHALAKLRRKGYVLTSQTALLRGINDSSETLVQLFEKLINCGVVPYYLHQFDRVQGAAHFETSVEKGLKLMEDIVKDLPGYAVPKYVREIPGASGKVNLLAHPDAKVLYE